MFTAVRICAATFIALIVALIATVVLSSNPELRAAAMVIMVVGMPCLFGILIQLDEVRKA